MPDTASAHRLRLLSAFFLIYFIWGSTYLAIRYAIETIPPFLMAGTRFLTAGMLMYGFLRLRGADNPSLKQWLQLGTVGVFMFLCGNGFVVWAEQFINSGFIISIPLKNPNVDEATYLLTEKLGDNPFATISVNFTSKPATNS